METLGAKKRKRHPKLSKKPLRFSVKVAAASQLRKTPKTIGNTMFCNTRNRSTKNLIKPVEYGAFGSQKSQKAPKTIKKPLRFQ